MVACNAVVLSVKSPQCVEISNREGLCPIHLPQPLQGPACTTIMLSVHLFSLLSVLVLSGNDLFSKTNLPALPAQCMSAQGFPYSVQHSLKPTLFYGIHVQDCRAFEENKFRSTTKA